MTEYTHHRNRQQRGAALPLVLIALLFMTMLGFMALSTSSIEVHLAANEREYQQAVYAAEGGTAHVRAILKDLLNDCNQSKIASGNDVDWDFVLQDLPDCTALAGQPRPLSIQASLGSYQYTVSLTNNADDPSASQTDDQDQLIVMTSIATGPNNVRAGIEIVLDTENSASETAGNTFQYGGDSGKGFIGRDANAITDMTTTNLGSL